VKGDAVVYSKGFGVRRAGSPETVDAETLFGMMSTTKAMTALAVAMLVDERKVAWNDPVTKHLPWFQLSDPYVTREITVRDLLRHNAGLGNADLLWARGDLSTREILERVRGLPLAYSLRAGYAYQNVMYQVAGEVVAAASGMPWSQFVKTRIMDPIGMRRSQPTLDALRAAHDPNVSAAHYEIDGSIRPIDEQPVDPVPAAGAAWSSASDAARWIRFWLNEGRVGDTRLVSEWNLRELLRPQAIIPVADFYPTASLTKPRWTTYGLGWFQQDYRGRFVAMHTGSIAGRTSIMALVPDEKIGVYVFGNTDHEEFRHALMWRAIDACLDLPRRDWSAEFLALYAGRKATAEKQAAYRESKRVAGTRPSVPLAQYAGTYGHPVWGDIEVEFAADALVVRIGPQPERAGRLEHWHFDTFRARLGDGRGGWSYFTFRLDADGGVRAMRMDDQASFEFVRRAKR
jgi:CubicO group peptidase (beta-lactamase class C family)